jgi:hypothetical protein
MHVRPAVVRAIEQPVAVTEAVLQVGPLVAQHAGLQASHGIEQGHRRQLSAGQDEVAETEFQADVPVQETLVHALVPATEHDRSRASSHLADQRLVDAAPGRREVDHGRLGLTPVGSHCLQRSVQGLGQQHHPRPAPEGSVVDPLVGPFAVVPQGPEPHIDLARLEGSPRNA